MKIRSLLLGSIAACGLATSGYAADLGTLIDCDTSNDNHDFDGFLLGASFGTMAVAMTPDGHFGVDPGGHLGTQFDKLDGSVSADGSGSSSLRAAYHGNVDLGETVGPDLSHETIGPAGHDVS